jgi:endo-1,4-beta-xylanase
VAGQAPAQLRVTMQRTVGGANAFDTIAQSAAGAVTDAGWVQMTGLYAFAGEPTGLLLYVEATTATTSYYIDDFRIDKIAEPPGLPPNTTGLASSFETGTTEGWTSRTGIEAVEPSSADAHTGTFSLLTTNRTAAFRGPNFNVTNVMFNGSRYRVSVWAKLAPGAEPAQLRVSLQRNAGTITTFHTVIGNTNVTADAWVRLVATYDVALANSSLFLYVESASSLASFSIDDVQVTYIPPPTIEPDLPSLHEELAGFFPVGAAVRNGAVAGVHGELLRKHFNSLTSENDMKWDATEPTEGTFTFTNADAEVNFAKANNMRVWGHTLVWHNQVPAWVFLDASGNPMTPTPANRELLIQRMRNHIQGVVTHFGTDVYSWDVVNEAIDQSQADGFRRTQFFNIIGPEYIDIAFQAAREFAPTAKLYYNDFSTTDTTKLGFIAALVSGMKNRGVPIDGVGHQMHNNVDFPSGAAVTNAINTIHALGVENAVTELDVSVYSGSFPGPVNDYTLIPPERFVRQGYRYLTFQEAFKQLALEGKLKSVTTWGKSDAQTWLTSATRVDGPLLFDVSFKKKHAYWAFVDPLQLPGADLATTMTAAPMTVPAGQAVAYTITVTNRADTDTETFKPTDDDLPAANVSLATAVPAHMVFGSLTVPAGWTCSQPAAGGTGPVQCTIASLPAGATATFTLTALLSDCSTPNATGITASANVTSTTSDPNPAPNNAASVAVQVSNPPPVITANGSLNMTVECATSFTDPGATAADACQGPVPVSSSSNVDVAHVGNYTVTYTAVDAAGGQATPVVRSVHVADTTPPAISVVGPIVLAPPNHQYDTFTIAGLVTQVSDSCSTGLGIADAVITKVSSDEVVNGCGDGDTLDDILIAANCRSVQLRSERSGCGNGRVYTITIHVQDLAGNRTTTSIKVLVPPNASSNTAIDDGPVYTVLSSCP